MLHIASRFAGGYESAADPGGFGIFGRGVRDTAAEMLATGCAGDESRELGFLRFFGEFHTLLPTLDFGLYSRKSIFVYDGFVAILDKVAATFAFIDNTFLSTEVFYICLLQQHISGVFFVSEGAVDIALTPLVAPDGFNAVLV